MVKTVFSIVAAVIVIGGLAPSARAEPVQELQVSAQDVICTADGAWCNPFEGARQTSEPEVAATAERARVMSELSATTVVVPGLVEVRLAADQLVCVAEEQWCFVQPEGPPSL